MTPRAEAEMRVRSSLVRKRASSLGTSRAGKIVDGQRSLSESFHSLCIGS